ncbi:transcriptional regulator [Deinococcus taeanensis]|uniref:transcriptional regulator n=1 Tax=Deinococcus taeanensis TaxID=2737050 RepID=UPI001CDC34E2|nr:transcriptional regulator [Deinococcus taeanensis]UBV42582.1 transcriptional regulator [Deinococcus taeanensis]
MRAARPVLALAALLSLSGAVAADLEDLLSALRRARTFTARGQVEVTVLFPPRSTPTRTATQLPPLPVRPALLARNFTVTRSGPDRVAGRAAARFTLTPRVGDAARWTLWVDRTWNVPLAFEERGADGTLARRAALSGPPPTLARVNRPAPAAPPGLRAALTRALPGLTLPPGFVPVGAQTRAAGLEITLSDGLNVLALVIAPKNVKAAPGVAARRVGRVFVWLVGNLPPDALQAALAGVRAADPAPLSTFGAPPDVNP